MVFSSLVFINCFLPAVMLTYFLAPSSWRNSILLTASILFYGFGEPKYLTVMLLCIIINYAAALMLEKSSDVWKKFFLFLAVVLNCGNLIIFKYLDFILTNLNIFLPAGAKIPLLHLVMPIGISFYTFQALSYVVDVSKGTVKAQKNIFDLALFIMFFPQLIAGPILKYHEFGPQLPHHDSNADNISTGLRRFCIGLGKKVLLANTIGIFVNRFSAIPPEQLPILLLWAGTAAYSMQIYFDFSGYSDMAIGLGKIFGFTIPENFNYPYVSRSITEFWRRWHISLSTWVRDYLYFPLGGSRCSTARACLNTMIVFTAVGFWHGASWSFILWGVWFGLLMVLERLCGYKTWQNKLPRLIQHLYFIVVYLISIVIFMTNDLNECWRYIARMTGITSRSDITATLPLDLPEAAAILFGIAAMFPLFKTFWTKNSKVYLVLQNAAALLILYLSFAFLCGATYNPFIYFRF